VIAPTARDQGPRVGSRRRDPRIAWGVIGLLAQVSFMAGWVISETWQAPGYSAFANTISDMQALNAPHVWFPIVCFAVGGVGSFCFLIFGLRPTLAPAGAVAAYAPWLLACATLAVGNSFPLAPCQLGPSCTAQQQLLSAGGLTDLVLSVGSFLAIVFSPQYLWRRLRLLPSWQPFRPVATVAEKACPALFLLLCAASIGGVGLIGKVSE